MNNHRSLLVKRGIYKYRMNGNRVTWGEEWVDERIDECFSVDRRRENIRLPKRVYVGECMGSR